MILDLTYVCYCVDPDTLPELTMDECLSLFPKGFLWVGGTCSVSSEAMLCPDRKDPKHRERLSWRCPANKTHWEDGIEVEVCPGNHKTFLWAFFLACYRARRAMGEDLGVRLDRMAESVLDFARTTASERSEKR